MAIRTIRPGLLALVSLCFSAMVSAQTPSAPAASPAEQAPTPSAQGLPPPPTAGKPSSPPAAAPQPPAEAFKPFNPSQKISPDRGVSFPVDI